MALATRKSLTEIRALQEPDGQDFADLYDDMVIIGVSTNAPARSVRGANGAKARTPSRQPGGSWLMAFDRTRAPRWKTRAKSNIAPTHPLLYHGEEGATSDLRGAHTA